jgi:hypothetical protein
MPTIRIDGDVYNWLQQHAKPFVDTPNSVLRRELGIARSVQPSPARGPAWNWTTAGPSIRRRAPLARWPAMRSTAGVVGLGHATASVWRGSELRRRGFLPPYVCLFANLSHRHATTSETPSRGAWVDGWVNQLVDYWEGRPRHDWVMSRARNILSYRSSGSILSVYSKDSILSVGSFGSILSVASVGSVLSILSVASVGSVLSIGAFGALLAVGVFGTAMAFGSYVIAGLVLAVALVGVVSVRLAVRSLRLAR